MNLPAWTVIGCVVVVTVIGMKNRIKLETKWTGEDLIGAKGGRAKVKKKNSNHQQIFDSKHFAFLCWIDINDHFK